IHLLVVRSAGDFVILDAEVAADAGLVQVRPEILEVEVEADVAIKVAIIEVSGIAFHRAPDLLGRFGVAAQRRDAALGTADRSVHPEARSRLRKEHAVRVGKEVAYSRIAQKFVDAW